MWKNFLTLIQQAVPIAERYGICAFLIVLHWKYTPYILGTLVAVTLITVYVNAYRRWNSGWLSHHVDIALREMRKKRAWSWKALFDELPRRREFGRVVLHYCYVGTRAVLRYIVSDFRRTVTRLYLPSFTSVALLGAIIGIVIVWPHWPTRLNIFWHPLGWPKELKSDFSDKQAEGVSRLFEALIVVIIALIVFVAESIRGSRSADEKRVLLKISRLWVLVVLVTISPLAFLYLPLTELTAALAIAMTLLTVWGFAQVLRNLLDPDASIREQRDFLKERVRDIVLVSARQRVGNRILFDRLKRGGTTGIELGLSRAFLPNGKKNYVIVNAPQNGIIDDINIAALERLGRFLAGLDNSTQNLSVASVATGQTSGPSPTAPHAGADNATARSFLLRRYREEISDDSVFSDDPGILAIPKSIATRSGVLQEVNGAIATMFRFTKDEPPSAAFRREMRSTKDRLMAAIQAGTLGEIEELRDSYRLVAEEFLTTLNALGGGYSAEQAQKERNDWFGSWDEVRWLTGDVRDILKAAADTKNSEVLRPILTLPFSIATRAFQAGDNLLFQQFISFASYIYILGIEQPETAETRAVLLDRSHRYIHDILSHFIQPLLTEEDDDD